MDRLSRDQEDIAGLFKRLTFAGVRIVTLSEGDVSHLHVGLRESSLRMTPVRRRLTALPSDAAPSTCSPTCCAAPTAAAATR